MPKSFSLARLAVAALLALATCLAHAQPSFATRRAEFADKQITSRGLELIANTPAEFAAVIKAEVVSTGEMVRAAGVKPE